MIRLRTFDLGDADAIASLANNRKIADNMRDMFPHPYHREDAVRFIQRVNQQSPSTVFAIELDGKPVGSIGYFPASDINRMNAEVGYWLGEPFWGKGIITEAIGKLVDHAFTHSNLSRLFAIPFPHNLASAKALARNGFELEATLKGTLIKHDRVMDELIYSIRREEWAKRFPEKAKART